MTHRRLLAAGALAVLGMAAACTPPPADPEPDPWETPKCWESVDPVTASTYYTGPENTLNNAVYASRGNNCATLYTTLKTVVRAPDQAAANALCQSLKGSNASDMDNELVDPPADGWRCF